MPSRDCVVRGRRARSLALGGVAALLACAPGAAARPIDQSPLADEVFYHFMPIAWRDATNDTWRFGDFQGMTDSLPYLQSLGITAVWMNPIFPSAAYHGYQHGPADLIDSDFGTQQQFLDFVAAAKAVGIDVYLDFVAYGISHNSVYYQNARNNPASVYDAWLAFTNSANTTYQGYTFNTWNGVNVGFIHWDLRTAAARDLVAQWGRKWLDPNGDGNPADGIAGYRFDHCWVTYGSGPSGWGYNLDTFWAPFFASLRTANPNVINFGEQANWGTNGTEFLGQFDAMFTIPWMFSARSAINSADAGAIAGSMASAFAGATSSNNKTFVAILGNHDVDRLTSVLGAPGVASPQRAHAAAAALILQPFPPCIYYGDEIGMLGTKQSYGSDADDIPMREPFKWNAVAGAPMSNYWGLNSQAFTNRFSQNNDGRSVQEQTGDADALLETYRSLIALRKNNIALRRGGYATAANSDSRVWSFLRSYAPTSGPASSALVLVNLSGSASNSVLNLSNFTLAPGGSAVTDMVSGATLANLTTANQSAYAVSVPAWGYRVLSVSLTVPPPPPSRVDGRDIPTTLAPALADVVQNTPTNLSNNVTELNRLMVRLEPDGVLVGVTGNLNTDGTALALFIDTPATTGQNIVNTSTLNPPPSGLADITGTVFDAGFAPEYLYFVNAFGGSIYVDRVTLTSTGSTKTYRGTATLNSASGILTGGSNPAGLQVALDNTNTGGVTASSVTNAALATRGFEFFIPFAELNITPPLCDRLRVSALIVRTDGQLANQVLPGISGTSANLGYAPNFTTIAGDQFVQTTIPPTCSLPCPGNADGNLVVNFGDITAVLASFGTSYVPTPGTGPGDADLDGSVTFADITSVLANFGAACN